MTRPYRFLSTLVKAPSDSTEQVAVESDFVVIFAALLCGLVCVVGLVAVARCAWIRRRSMSGQASANKGIKKKLVEALPKLVYESGKEGKGDCAICLTEYADGDEIRVLPPCRHAFHVACIDRWLASHSSCPSCRQILRCKNCGGTETSATVRTSTN